MDAVNWFWIPCWLAAVALTATLSSWILSALTYEHVRHDIESWATELREAHLRQLAHDRSERQIEHDHVLFLLDRLISRLHAGRNGNHPE